MNFVSVDVETANSIYCTWQGRVICSPASRNPRRSGDGDGSPRCLPRVIRPPIGTSRARRDNDAVMKRRYFLSIFLCVWFSVANSDPSRSQASSLKDQLGIYCQEYILALADMYHASTLAEMYGGAPVNGKAQVDEIHSTGLLENIMSSIGNIFQPPDSKFHSGYICEFHLDFKETELPGSLRLLLVENKAFAEYTKWDRAQIVDIGEVTYSDQKYYVVVKYIKVDGRSVKFNLLKDL